MILKILILINFCPWVHVIQNSYPHSCTSEILVNERRMRETISRSFHFYARVGVWKHMNWACSCKLSEWNKGKIFALTKSQRSKRQLRSSLRWLFYIINSVIKTKLSSYTPPTTQHHSFFRNQPSLFIFLSFIEWFRLSELSIKVGKNTNRLFGLCKG